MPNGLLAMNHCEATHEGSSGSMQSKSAVYIFSRSVQTNNLRYIRYVGDGDTNSYKSVLKPYRPEKPIVKVECVGHVKKSEWGHACVN